MKGLAKAICPQAALQRELDLAIVDPVRYVEKFARRLALRGVDAPSRDLGWLALFDGLLARRKAVEIDHRDAPADFLPALRKLLPRGASLPSVAELDRLAPAKTKTLLDVIGDRVPGRLFVIDSGSDSYVVVAAKALPSSPRVRKLGGANLLALQKAAAKADRATERQDLRRKQASKLGGPTWQKLMSECDNLASLLLMRLSRARTPSERRRFAEGLREAPPAHQPRMQNLAQLIEAPEIAAKRLDPVFALEQMPHLPQAPELIGPRVRAIEILSRRIRLAADPKATRAFWTACGTCAPFRAVARRALSAGTLSSWARLAEAPGSNFSRTAARYWLADERTLDLLAPRTPAPRRDEIETDDQRLVKLLAKEYGRKLAWAPAKSRRS